MSALDELKSMSSRHERVDTEAALAALKRSAAQEGEEEVDLDEEDEAAVRQMILQQRDTTTRRHALLPLGIFVTIPMKTYWLVCCEFLKCQPRSPIITLHPVSESLKADHAETIKVKMHFRTKNMNKSFPQQMVHNCLHA